MNFGNLKYAPWLHPFSLYQGEGLGEEQSVIGEVDKDKIPVTGNSRFGCWCCTIVKEDKSLLNFIKKGSTELIPLRDFRNWLVSIRQNPKYRDTKRRDGSVYYKADGTFGFGPFTMWGRQQILRRLLELQRDTQMELITMEELKVIDQMWDNEGDLSKRLLVDTYYEVYGQTIFGDHDLIFKCLIMMNAGQSLTDDEYFPKTVKAHLDRGAQLLENEDRYTKNLCLSLCNLDKTI